MSKFLTDNTPQMRLMRTILQGVIGVVISQLPAIADGAQLDPAWSAAVAALVMAVLSPIMAALGEGDDPEVYGEGE